MTGDSNWSSDVETAESSKLPDCQLDNPRGYRGFDSLSQESQPYKIIEVKNWVRLSISRFQDNRLRPS